MPYVKKSKPPCNHKESGCTVRGCNRCQLPKWSCEFYPSRPNDCKACLVTYQMDWQSRQGPEYAERRAAEHRLRKYGVTREEFDRMLKEQDGKCAICKTFEPGPRALSTLQVDHDHETGKVRGLLCQACNTLIGKAREDVTILMAAALYLTRNGGQ